MLENEASFRARAPRTFGWPDGSQTVPQNAEAARPAFQPTARDFPPPICRRVWPAVLRVAKACLRDLRNSFFALKEVNQPLCQISIILCADAARRVQDYRQVLARGFGDPDTMPNIRLEQDRLFREHPFLTERGHRKFKLIHGQPKNIACLPVMTNDQSSNIWLPAPRKVGREFLPHLD